MPRIGQSWIRPVVYMFGCVEDAKRSRLEDDPNWPQPPGKASARAATGCLIDFHSRGAVHQYVVTNLHVVQQGLVVPRITCEDRFNYIIDVVLDDWYCNLLPTDLAILPVPQEFSGKIRGIAYSPYPNSPDEFLDKNKDFAFAGVHIGDEVAMSGRFYPSSGGESNQPVTRFGNIAKWPPADIQLPWFSAPAEAILVEMRSHSGYSGSPAFVFGGISGRVNSGVDSAIIGLLDPLRRPPDIEIDWRDVRFLGLDCGHLAGNIAVVIPWFKVSELLMSDTLAGLRRKSKSLDPSGSRARLSDETQK